MGFSPDQVHEFYIHTDAIPFNQVIHNYEAESRFKISIGSTSMYNLKSNNTESIVKTDIIELGKHLYGFNISANAAKPKDITAEYMSKVWSIHK